MGLKPPKRSDVSVWVERLSAVRVLPHFIARYCTAVVLPVPVSPTSNVGSDIMTAALICSKRIKEGRVRAKGVSDTRLAGLLGTDKRPMYRWLGETSNAGRRTNKSDEVRL